jgi:uncharacterized protein YprB with RNaseH-like and TPR domain
VNQKKRDQNVNFARAVDILEQKLKQNKDFKVVNRSESIFHFNNSFSKLFIEGFEYKKAFKLKESLMRDYEGKLFRDIFPGNVLSNEFGECFCISEECPSRFKKPDYTKSRDTLMSDLKLVCGIGSVRERELKQQGYSSIDDLVKNPKWKGPASDFIAMVENNDVGLLQTWLGRFFPKSHPLVHYLAGLLDYEDFVLLDIETLGLFGRAIILLGVARPSKNGAYVNQYLLRDIPEEPATLLEFISHIENKTVFITYNGRSFDVPSIQQRLNYYGMEDSLNNPHFDLLHFARRAWHEFLPDCRLETVEKNLGIHRKIDLPSALVPDFYEEYLKTGNIGPLVPIVEHNKQDLLTLATLFSKLYEVWDL